MSNFAPLVWLRRLTLFSLFSLVLAGCQIESNPKSELEKVRERGTLRVGTLNNQLSYYIGPDGPTGLDFELAKRFADELGVKLEMKPAYRLAELFPALERGEIDMIAAGLSQTPDRLKLFRAGPAYYYVSQQVVYKKGSWRPRNVDQLVDKQIPIVVVKDSHFERTLKALQKEKPGLVYRDENDADVNDLLQKVYKGELALTMADSVELSLSQRLYPSLALAFELTEDQPISWYMRRSDDESLYALLIEFFGLLKQSGDLARLEEKYFGHVESFDFVDTRAFIRALDSKLPKWESLFKKHSNEFDWRLIAALAYQESHWNPLAKSPTGVRGMMMLTLPTAKSVGVKNRLDPEQSVRGGVEYLRRIVDRVPDSISEHEKIWFALASYNVGYGHMMDARRLTKRQGGDPDSWADVKDRLPLLRKKEFYSKTRYGYARGDEARNYVENIRRYYQSIIGHVDKQRIDNEELSIDDLQVIDVPISSATGSVSSSVSTNDEERSENENIDSNKASSEESKLTEDKK
ncbi:Membrane-bound lytic murein transglycosylase F [Vibrio nigripulchritudo SFn27]|uniref:Membrane-bound lytic murein transglycosylase F n=1 Tax=Vibrio nigripulchritudo TaxID=28173 RepID=U4KDE3_9VIBR|nr:membrane-bound lytic murein transglycosylase MltF [Vibrio nigripulchritudo]CCN72041.1 Membrane-bound lytic murein transglycosylase F [Vibrio nigripulchritudo SFn118]CCN81869.1 Membrane-bound lytic murein transglycosylase F [Vibrio nigripulchritudo BLFn1]CCN88334.1 Membrane-bound lytic murein transglycosylase F [Vibrio nigripulchritudo SFn27]CCN95325.1 Membrane-bound lytic murein transglycosylase F [Vibrio nigripulchritudo ENn2]CCO41321.1 Membrane-bound lytic murein transglycosylase F [Vibri